LRLFQLAWGRLPIDIVSFCIQLNFEIYLVLFYD
jgi:hypothetical protein